MKRNNKPRILVNLPPSFFTVATLKPHMERLRKIGEVNTSSHNTPEEILPDLKKADIVLMWAWPLLDDKVLEQCPDLRFIAQLGTTQKQAKICLNRKLPLSETRHCWSPAVSEMALTLTLCGLRKISDYHMQMRSGNEAWIKDFPADIDPLERQLGGRTVGIVGFGKIGQGIAELMKPFKVKLLVYDPYLPAKVAKDFGAEQLPLIELAENSDVCILCAANNPGTSNLVDRKTVSALKKDSILVNVGRASLIDMEALCERLKKNDLIAMLDVFDIEPLPIDSPLRKLSNAYLTPHRAGGVWASLERGLSMLTDEIELFLKDEKRKYNVDEAMIPALQE